MKRNEGALALALAGALVIAPLVTAPLGAQSLDAASEEALAATLQMLTDPALRGPAIAGSPQGAAADQQIQALAGSPALTEEIYALAAQIFDELARASGGDARQMLQTLERGQSDPAGFAALLSPATLQRLRELSTRIADEHTRRP
jgi:hypothetical protein